MKCPICKKTIKCVHDSYYRECVDFEKQEFALRRDVTWRCECGCEIHFNGNVTNAKISKVEDTCPECGGDMEMVSCLIRGTRVFTECVCRECGYRVAKGRK